MLKKPSKIVKFLLGTVLLASLVIWLGPKRIIGNIAQADTTWLVPLILLYSLNLIFGGIGLFSLMGKSGVSIKKFFKLYFFSQSLGSFLPFQMGESTIILLAKNKNVSYYKLTAAFLLDKIVTALVLGGSGIIGLSLYFRSNIVFKLPLNLLIVVLIIILFIFIVLCRFSNLKHCVPVMKAMKIISKIRNELAEVAANNRKGILINFLTSAVRRLALEPLMVLLLFRSLGVNAGFPGYLFTSNIIGLISLLPLTPQGIGISELGSLYLFAKIGIQNVEILSYSLLSRVTSSIFSGIIVIICLLTVKSYRNKYFARRFL